MSGQFTINGERRPRHSPRRPIGRFWGSIAFAVVAGMALPSTGAIQRPEQRSAVDRWMGADPGEDIGGDIDETIGGSNTGGRGTSQDQGGGGTTGYNSGGVSAGPKNTSGVTPTGPTSPGGTPGNINPTGDGVLMHPTPNGVGSNAAPGIPGPGAPTAPSPITVPPDPRPIHWILIATALAVLSTYLFAEAQRFHHWSQGSRKNRLDSWTGSFTLLGIGLAIALMWGASFSLTHAIVDEQTLWWVPILWPRSVAVPVLIYGSVAASLALMKIGMALPLAAASARRSRATQAEKSSPLVASVTALFALVGFLANLAALWGALHGKQ